MKRTEKQTPDANVQAANEIYQVAQAEANQKLQAMKEETEDIRQESFAQGVIRSMESVSAYTELMKYVSLYRIKQHKEYRKGGLTWDGFCDSLGLERRNVDRVLEDISPLMADFSDKVHMISNIPFNKIRHLGRAISGQLSEITNGALVYKGESIPLTPEHADEIQALIEEIQDAAKAAKDEAEATVKAKDRVLQAKEKVIQKQEKELHRLSREAGARDLLPQEDAFLQKMDNLGTAFDGYMLKMDPDVVMAEYEEAEITPRMRAALITKLDYMRMQLTAAYDTAVTNYGDPNTNPELMADFEKWQQQA